MKIQEGYHGNEESQAHTRLPSSGFQGQEEESPKLLAAIPVGVESGEETSGAQAVPLTELIHGLTYSDSLPLAPALGWRLEGHQSYTGRD